jgi:predicted DNA-binding transcriptional regulator YafY
MPELTPAKRAILIYQKLMTQGYVTIEGLYKYFKNNYGDNSVTKRTLSRDMENLRDADIPFDMEHGKGNQKIWKLDQSLEKIIPIPFEFNHIIALYLLKNAMPLLKQSRIFNGLEGAYDKIAHLISGDDFDKFEIVQTLFYHKEFGTLDFTKFDHIVSKLIDAILEKNVCEILYKKTNDKYPKRRRIKPHKFIYYKGVLYVIVYNDKKENFFTLSLSRISDIRVLEETFTISKEYNPKDEENLKFGLTPPFKNTGIEHIVIKVSAGAADYFENISWHSTQKTKRDDDGSLIFEMDSYINDELLGWILSWKDNITVLQPNILIQLILEKIKIIKKKYLNGQYMTNQTL